MTLEPRLTVGQFVGRLYYMDEEVFNVSYPLFVRPHL